MFKVHRSFDLFTGVKNNTIAVIAQHNAVDVIYHRTLVVSKRSKTITLRNGGWDTVSTRTVINRALYQLFDGYKFYVESKKGECFLVENTDQGAIRKPFVSGMKVKVAS